VDLSFRDSAAALRLSRGLLAISIAGSVVIASVPVGDTGARPFVSNRDDKAGGGGHTGVALGKLSAARDPSEIRRDPFAPIGDVQSARQPSRAPTVPPAALAPSGSPPVRVPDVPQLLGTVVDRIGGSFAICALGTGAPKTLRVGGRIGGYRVDSIGPGIAVVVDSTGRALVLRFHPRS
jgi:hypothetical protein